MAFVQTAHSLVPANPKSLMSIEPKNTHRYPVPITRTMLRRPQDPPDPTAVAVAPTLTSLDPATMPVKSADFVLSVYGTAFTPQTVIMWNGVAEPTEFVDDNEVTTVVRASLATVPATITVGVTTGALAAETDLTFTFT